MPSVANPTARVIFPFLICLGLLVPSARAQETQTPPEKDDEVIRISADLVQTDVTVFDKQGRFIDGLRSEQFELRVDGKPQPISFFERVTAGSIDEDAQLAAARGGVRSSEKSLGTVQPLDRGRTLFFFVDDLHLSTGSVARARNTLLRFINDEMGQNDEAAVASSSGQLGFLQQLTGDKTVLRTAVERINYRPYQVRDFENPPMTEVQAFAIEQNDRDVIDYFVERILRENPLIGREAANNMVMTRARNILQQSAAVTTNTLASLESIVRSSAPLPGRKLVFFISDGFLLDHRTSNVLERLRRITDAAARAGVVIYTMDAQGLATGVPDAGTVVAFDPTGRLSRVNAGELSSFQEPLHTLAADTGGRALVNTNALGAVLTKTLKETAIYYLLAWRPDRAEGRTAKFRRIEVKIKERPDLTVLVRRGFFSTQLPALAERNDKKGKPAADPSPDKELMSALGSLYPRSALPTSLSVGYVSAPDLGIVVTASLEIEGEALNFETDGRTQNPSVDVVGAVFDDRGKLIASFKQELTITSAAPPRTERPPIVYSRQFKLVPGLYQVRVAALDRQSRRTGSASQWVEIPDLQKGKFSLSSIFVGERKSNNRAETGKDPAALPEEVVLSANRRFARTSWLRFMTYIYNATGGGGAAPADVALQIQVFRDDQPVITTPLRKIETSGAIDPSRIPYAAEITLNSLPIGRYVLQVTAIDRGAKASASQRVHFMVR